MSKRALALPVLAAVGALALAGCGTSNAGSGATSPGASATGAPTSSASPIGTATVPSGTAGSPSGAAMQTPKVTATGSPATGAHNDADVTFATDMVPHHLSAIEMAQLAPTRAGDPAVKALATRITAAQGPEVTTMAGWLVGWGKPVPGASMSGDTPGMAGAMSPAEMTSLANSTGPAFDRMWTKMMTVHHQGAVTMARTELTAGANPQAKALAQAIITGQTAEIAQLQKLLTQLPT